MKPVLLIWRGVVLSILCLLLATARLRAAPLELHDQERIVFVGDDFLEGDGDQAFIETNLTVRYPDKQLIFRNLGYAGDTALADARNLCAGWSNFGPDDQGFKRLTDLLARLKPTLVFVDYGSTESFNGAGKIAEFQRNLDRMLDMIAGQGHPRIVLLTPTRHELLPPPLPDPTEHNRDLAAYVQAIGSIAARRGYPLVDLFSTLPVHESSNQLPPLTYDGIHLGPKGYWLASQQIMKQLGLEAPTWSADLGSKSAKNATLSEIKALKDGVLGFALTEARLPDLPPPDQAEPTSGQLKAPGLGQGNFVLRSGSKTCATGSAEQWAKGITPTIDPALSQTLALRELIRQKNFAFYNDWRSQNDTYILGYRAHEQGRNAPEIEAFRHLAEQKDEQIASARRPSTVYCTLEAAKQP